MIPGGSIPLRIDGVTPSWLAAALAVPAGSIRSVRVVDEHSGTAARARIEVDADLDVGLPERLFVKFMPHDFAQHTMMNLFQLGRREVHLYQTMGDAPPIRVPRCYAAEVDGVRGRNIMIFEDLTGTATFRTVCDSLGADEAQAVVDAMTDLHIAYWEDTSVLAGFRPISARSPGVSALGDLIRRRFLGNMKGPTADLVPADMKRKCRILFERSADIDAFWASQPQTLLHGDPHLGNLFFEGASPGFLDWQVAMSGAGMRDVAYFATVSVEPTLLRRIERDLVERYAARLEAVGIVVDADHLWDLYRAGVTEMFMSAVCAAEAGDRAQPADVARSGVERSVAGVEAHDSFDVLAALIDGKRP